jgi:FlaA1/EpsC-like NDP-sugar epimerase
MGEPVKIKWLAEEMIRLAGREPYKEIDIQFTGLRPGEKMYEEILYNTETVKPTHHPKILVGSIMEYDYQEIVGALSELFESAKRYQSKEVVKQMKNIIPEYISLNSKYSVFNKNEQR